MYFVRTPTLLQALLPGYLWRVPDAPKTLFLTFDDGPIPEVTPWVLDILKRFDARATFFCVGENVLRHPDVFACLRAEGHAVGNHTFNHLNGWESATSTYLDNVRRCSEAVPGTLFRPPYGRLKPSQSSALTPDFRIVMWDVLSGDFDPKISKEKCLHNVLENAHGGSIVVFHDSLKAEEKLRFALPRVLEFFAERGFAFEALHGGHVSQ